METVKNLNKWANAHTYYPLDLLRIALGVFLFLKGTKFIVNSQYLIDLIEPFQSWMGSMMMIHYVAPAHMVGGILIAFGLLTRWSAAAQIPILIGAVAINFVGEPDPLPGGFGTLYLLFILWKRKTLCRLLF